MGNAVFLAFGHDFGLRYTRHELFKKYICIMAVIDLNEICKIIYYKYISPFKVLGIIGGKHSQTEGFSRKRQINEH